MLTRFLECKGNTLRAEELQAFEQLLELQDPQLQAYLQGSDTPACRELAGLVKKIRYLVTA